MKKIFSIGEAAKEVGMTSETLRHYDRIGLVTPSQKDEWTNYRYYTAADIVLLNTVRALQQMDLPLKKIKEVLEYDDIEKIIDFLNQAEKRADEKIALLKESEAMIRRARADYERKPQRIVAEDMFIERFPEQVILLSDTLNTPTLDNLWNYLDHFYNKVGKEHRELFEFEDTAGIYTENDKSRLFAVCVKYEQTDGLLTLPEGKYLCADATEQERGNKLNELLKTAKKEYNVEPKFTVHQIVVSGILQWNYRIRVFLGKNGYN